MHAIAKNTFVEQRRVFSGAKARSLSGAEKKSLWSRRRAFLEQKASFLDQKPSPSGAEAISFFLVLKDDNILASLAT